MNELQKQNYDKLDEVMWKLAEASDLSATILNDVDSIDFLFVNDKQEFIDLVKKTNTESLKTLNRLRKYRGLN